MFEALVVQTAGYAPEAVTELTVPVGGLQSLVQGVETVGLEEVRDASVDAMAVGTSDMIVEVLSDIEEDPVPCSVWQFWRLLVQV